MSLNVCAEFASKPHQLAGSFKSLLIASMRVQLLEARRVPMRLPNESGYLYEFGWLRGPQNLLKGKNFLVAVDSDHPNYFRGTFSHPDGSRLEMSLYDIACSSHKMRTCSIIV